MASLLAIIGVVRLKAGMVIARLGEGSVVIGDGWVRLYDKDTQGAAFFEAPYSEFRAVRVRGDVDETGDWAYSAYLILSEESMMEILMFLTRRIGLVSWSRSLGQPDVLPESIRNLSNEMGIPIEHS